jgi:hypothetical protein
MEGRFQKARGYLVIGDNDGPEQKWSEWKDERSMDEQLS